MTESSTGNNPDPNPIAPHTEAPEPAKSTSNVTEKHHSSKLPRVSLETYWRRKKWTLPMTALFVLLIVFLVPLTRYRVLGLFLKETVSVSVIDSTTGTPISGARLQFGNATAITTASGKTTLTLPVGNDTVNISKQYYKSASDNIFTSLTKSRNSVTLHLAATGRQGPVVIINKINGQPVANADIKVLDTEAKTDKSGKAIIVLPAGAATQHGTVNADGYNQTAVTVQVTGLAVAANTYSLTPAGHIYFLSNLSGKIDVVKTNLDGTNRQTVLAGTGYESRTDTVLLASRDWKYLALYAQRSKSGNPEIDLIDTSTDKMSNIDEGNARFTLVGWDGDYFTYIVNRDSVQNWENGQQALKSFDAHAMKIIVLAQTTASGSSQTGFIQQRISDAYIISGKVVYNIGWSASCWYSNYCFFNQINTKQTTLSSVNPDGSNNIVVKSFGLSPGAQASDLYLSLVPYDGPNSLAIDLSPDFYEYQDGKVTPDPNLSSQVFSNGYPTYLLSPSGNKTFWSVYADGKNNLTVGDGNGQNTKTIAAESDYSPYGWFSDNYLLVQKSGSELYIMSSDGTSQPFKISNYYKPQVSYRGYGGGYGGL